MQQAREDGKEEGKIVKTDDKRFEEWLALGGS